MTARRARTGLQSAPEARCTDELDFEAVVLPHLEAGRRLARWLVRDPDDAEDVVQDASVRALRYFRTFTGGNGRAWFLRIVRNASRTWRQRAGRIQKDLFDEALHTPPPAVDPERGVLRLDDVTLTARALEHLPARYRELLVLREVQELSYRELAERMQIPIGTVMSSLSRARRAFRAAVDRQTRAA